MHIPLFDTDTHTYTDPPPPNEVKISTVHKSIREVTFSWSPVTYKCPIISYNILSSNCGSCPTTTNHTNVTCTDVRTVTTTCQFAVQSVVCGHIAGNTSDPVDITFFRATTMHASTTLLENQSTHNTDATEKSTLGLHQSMVYTDKSTGSVYIVLIISLATGVIVNLVISITVIATILTRRKADINLQLTHSTGGGRTQMNEGITCDSLSASAVKTEDNISYGNKHTQSTPNDELISDNITQTGTIGTQNNPA